MIKILTKPGNWELKIGTCLLLLLILIAIIGPFYAPYDPNYTESIRKVTVNGVKKTIFSPEKPGARHWFGTDFWGYDILTMMLYGAKYTLSACFLIALLRVFLGTVLGLFLGIKKEPSQKFESLGGVPSFVILVFIFYGLGFNSSIPTVNLFLLEVFFIAIVGLPGVLFPIQKRTNEITQESFIEAAISIGADKIRIVTKHIFPQLRGYCLTILITEMITALNIIGQLGIFFIFLGGTIFTQDPPLLHSATNEWMGIIGQSRNKIFSQPWLLLIPLCAYIIVLLSFHLISQGIEKYYEKK
mgnify:FL=1